MGHIQFEKNSKKRSWVGFAIALAVCLVAIGGVGIATFVSSWPSDDDKSGTSSISTTKTTQRTQSVGQIVTNIPDTRTTTAAPTTKTTVDDQETNADLFILPLSNMVLRDFSKSQPVYSPTMKDWRMHNGVDFQGQANQPVKALADGTVKSIIEKDLMWGEIVIIDHGNGFESKYCGVKVADIDEGDKVTVGKTIGVLADIPCEIQDGPHLHLEITVNGEYINPVQAIGRDVKKASNTTAATTKK